MQNSSTEKLPIVSEISVRDLANFENPTILDVREAWERDIAVIPNTLHIPEDDLPNRLIELPRNKTIYVHCRSGVRSARSTDVLLKAGFDAVFNVTGGILAWADEIDPTMKQYEFTSTPTPST